MSDGKQLLQGIFAINKPPSISSAQVVRDVQWHFDRSPLFQPLIADQLSRLPPRKRLKRQKQHVKLGHGGTLDPLATGVLILGIGSGTKILSTFLNCWKTYETVVVFGAATDTYDRLGKVVARDETGFHKQQEQVEIKNEEEEKDEERNRRGNPYEHVTKEKVLAALDKFRGKFWQIPPIYSAKWMNGKRLYDYARQGLPLPEEIKGKEVQVEEMEMLEWLEPGTHGYGIPDNVIDQTVDDADGNENAGNKKKKDEMDDGVAISSSTEQMARGVKRARRDDDDGKDRGALISTAVSTEKSPSQTTSHSPKRVKLDTQVNEPIAKSHDMDVRTDTLITEPADTLFPTSTTTTTTTTTTTNDEDITSYSAHKTTLLNTNTPSNAAPSSSSSYATLTIPSEPQSRSQQQPPPPLPGQQSHHNHQDPSSPSPPAAKLRMTVSSGFYVRSLCHDLGIAIGSFGFMADLVRTRQADFGLGPENQESKDTDHDDGKDKDKTKDEEDGKEKEEEQKQKKVKGKGNVLEYADLQRGEEVWGPRVKELIREDVQQNVKQNSSGGGRNRNGNGHGNWRGTDRARKNTSSPE